MPTIFNKDNDLIYIYWTDLRWYDISIRFVLKLITHVLNMQWYFVHFFSCTKGVKVPIHLYEPKNILSVDEIWGKFVVMICR